MHSLGAYLALQQRREEEQSEGHPIHIEHRLAMLSGQKRDQTFGQAPACTIFEVIPINARGRPC
jgi:hypothetical protein